METETIEKKPRVELIGHDGNAFSIMGRCRRAAVKAGWSREQIDDVMTKMRSGDYDDLLATAITYFDID